MANCLDGVMRRRETRSHARAGIVCGGMPDAPSPRGNGVPGAVHGVLNGVVNDAVNDVVDDVLKERPLVRRRRANARVLSPFAPPLGPARSPPLRAREARTDPVGSCHAAGSDPTLRGSNSAITIVR